MLGRIHSIETMGLLDGPGIRVVIFLQGCGLRCLYCHNPDTWEFSEGTEMSSEELIKKIVRYKPYFERSKGGVTFSGGEPILQKEFLIDILKKCKENNIHTCIDTAGYGDGDYEELLKYVDLILFDIKHISEEGYTKVTQRKMDKSLEFLEKAQEMGKEFWIRHVVVPGVTDGEEHLENVFKMVEQIKNVKKFELLPYHVLGVNKYEKLGIEYKLKGVEPMNKEYVKEKENEFNKRLGLI